MSKTTTIFVCGPKGCGKTINADLLAGHFVDEHGTPAAIVDNWQPGHSIKRGAVHLTCHSAGDVYADTADLETIDAHVVDFAALMEIIPLKTPAPRQPVRGCIPVTLAVPGYERLADILGQAFQQSAQGKGVERHANGQPWEKQSLITLAEYTGHGGPQYQLMKKTREAGDMANRGEKDAAKREILGAIVYAAAMFHVIDTQEKEPST